MKKMILILSLALIIGSPVDAKRKKKKDAPKPPAKKERRAPARQGLFNVQHHNDDWFFQIPDSLLGQPFLSTTRYVSTPVGTDKYGGELANEQVLYWEKQGKNMLLRSMIYGASADTTSAIYRAVRSSSSDPIVASIKMDSTITDSVSKSKLYSIKVTDLFKGDNAALSIHSSQKTKLNLTAFKADLSYIDHINTYPMNTEIVTVKTFTAKNTGNSPSGQATGLSTLTLNTSFVMLPKSPMRYRTFDPRVGYFADRFAEYTDEQQSAKTRVVCTRWRLEPREEDIEKMKRGELVEPKKPIVFYIDPATPKQWRKYLIAGVNDWQSAFEQAGWKNAIHAEEWPEDSTMSMEDARYSVIRYLASQTTNAYGPQIHDPRTGEILESHIGWYHNVMKLIHDWYMVQAGVSDKRAQKMEFDEELMGKLIRFVSSHEVGHTLGLRHNMGASSATPVEKLRDKAWVEKNGHTASIMDYARFNYVAQPEDNIGEAGLMPRINDYDKWAIEWGYKYFPDAKTEKEERLALNKMTVEKLSESRRFWFGGEGYDNDPKALSEDLGDDAMKASDYGVKNLKRVVKALPQWTYEEGDLDENLSRMHSQVVIQMRLYVGHVRYNIGGVYHDYKSVEQDGPVYTQMDKATQKRALAWLNQNVFTEPTWLISEPYVKRLSKTPQSLIEPLAETTLSYLCSATLLGRIYNNAAASPKNAYQPAEYVDDLVGYLFTETRTGATLTPWRIFLQQQAVGRAIKAWGMMKGNDGRAAASYLLRTMRQRLTNARSYDGMSKAHYQDLLLQINLAFEGK